MDSTMSLRYEPVSKFLLGSALGSSIMLNLPFRQYQVYFICTQSQLFDKGQVWRCLSSKMAFLDLKDLFVCSVLIYYFRVFEKRFGSKNFAGHLLGSALLSTLLEVLVMCGCRHLDIRLDPLPSGPLCFIYPLFVPFYCDIPRVPLSHLWGIPMTGKSICYILGLQAASTSPESIIVALCGLTGGLLWRLNFLKIQSLVRVPKFIATFCSATIGRLFGVERGIVQDTSHIGATREFQRQEAMERLEQQMLWRSLQQNNVRPQVQNLVNGPGIFGMGNNNMADGLRNRFHEPVVEEPVEVSEEQVQQLVEMGFHQEQSNHIDQLLNINATCQKALILQ
ncbi:ubiquitin-associated domain-containing protein 2-like isoform X2 [Dreissena polymorpha]|nr:ubiquitin-associated domain-containing protein 2-like isoform X2 [Dreissena polymorpha]